MCASLLSTLALCLSSATALGQGLTITSGQTFFDFGTTTASPTGNVNTATSFGFGNVVSSSNHSGIFAGMPMQFIGPVTLVPAVGTSFNFGNSVFGQFTSTSITTLPTTAGFANFDATGFWTPGTYCNPASNGCAITPLIRQAFPAGVSVTMTQTPPTTGGVISPTWAFVVTTPLPDLEPGPQEPGEPPPVIPPAPPADPGDPRDPASLPNIGPTLATYGVVQPFARQMGLAALGTFHERFGDAAADAACLAADSSGTSLVTKDAPIIVTKAPPAPCYNSQQGAWGRVFGQQVDNHYEAFADPRATGQIIGFQTGLDLYRGSLIQGHSDAAGLYFAYGNGNVGVDGLVTNAADTAYILQHTGSVNLNAYSVGGYWTHYGPTGWYIDAVLQGTFYSGNATTQFTRLPSNGTGFISSLEGGYPIPLSWFGPHFVLEPESQIIWQQVSFRDADDGFGPIGLGTTSGATGRFGLRGKWTINDPAGRVWQPYVLANLWRDWGADATTMFGSVPVPLRDEATRLEFASGFSARILPRLSLYAQAGYQFAVSDTDGGRRDGVRGDLGVRWAW